MITQRTDATAPPFLHDDVIKWKHFPRYWPMSVDVFFDLRLNKRSSKQSWGWWFETPSRSLWCHCNAMVLTRRNSWRETRFHKTKDHHTNTFVLQFLMIVAFIDIKHLNITSCLCIRLLCFILWNILFSFIIFVEIFSFENVTTQFTIIKYIRVGQVPYGVNSNRFSHINTFSQECGLPG